jgi:hypothetical protein
MSGGGVFLHGEWLAVGSRVLILRSGYEGKVGLFKGKTRTGKLSVAVNFGSFAPVKLTLRISEIRRAERGR